MKKYIIFGVMVLVLAVVFSGCTEDDDDDDTDDYKDTVILADLYGDWRMTYSDVTMDGEMQETDLIFYTNGSMASIIYSRWDGGLETYVNWYDYTYNNSELCAESSDRIPEEYVYECVDVKLSKDENTLTLTDKHELVSRYTRK